MQRGILADAVEQPAGAADKINVAYREIVMKPSALHISAGILATALAPPLATSALASSEAVIYSFKDGTDGATPHSGLIDVGGTLYGTTYQGGVTACGLGCGTVFSVTPAGVETTLYAFKTPHGARPFANLIELGTSLYGLAAGGGASKEGTFFKIAAGGAERTLYSFGSGSDGTYPFAGLIDVGGTLYGTTGHGGAFGHGTVFSITRAGVESVLYSFKGGSDGDYPFGSLVDVKGTLYGTTINDGAYGGGTVFSVTLGGGESVLHSFGNTGDGSTPQGSLLKVGDRLFGTTTSGGSGTCGGSVGDCGTVFRITLTGVETPIYSFQGGTDGAGPVAGLIDVGGTLYGTTTSGGAGGNICSGGCGTVFKITDNGIETVLHAFTAGNDGWAPFGELLNVGGVLYGTTAFAGASNYGTVFTVTP
jgi:uncharacterized repeat protein (TIGR03803 family)